MTFPWYCPLMSSAGSQLGTLEAGTAAWVSKMEGRSVQDTGARRRSSAELLLACVCHRLRLPNDVWLFIEVITKMQVEVGKTKATRNHSFPASSPPRLNLG